jgi:hypothetical protein
MSEAATAIQDSLRRNRVRGRTTRSNSPLSLKPQVAEQRKICC